MIGNTLYVAKKFFEAGSGPVGLEENSVLLRQELVRLMQIQWFWKHFQTLARDKAVDICNGACFIPWASINLPITFIRS